LNFYIKQNLAASSSYFV